MTILFFCLSGLDILDNISVIDSERRAEIIEWIYSHQILPDQSDGKKETKRENGWFNGRGFYKCLSASVERLILYFCALIRIKFIKVWF